MAKPSEKINRETKYRTIAVAAAPFIIIGGICIGFGLGWRYVSRVWNKENKENFPKSMCFAAIHGGKLAMERLVDYHNYRDKATDIDDIKELETLLGNEQPRFEQIQRVPARLEMSRREDEAIKVLKKALKKAKKEKKSNEAYEIEMLLAEMYIYKGDFRKALKSKCLVQEDQWVSDSRRPLYKAIILLMEQKQQEAQEHWTKFKEIQHETIPPSFHEEEFIEFKNAVNLLKQDIDTATQLKNQ